MEIKKAVRRALPMQLAFYAPTGAGKTFSALRFAAGLSPNGKVVVVDTERGRASLYADNRKILADLPGGFDVIELDQPYTPERFIEAMDLAESQGYKVCIIDSGSDSWSGPGGCSDIAEKAKNMWAGAKLRNKRMMTRAGLSDMHIIWSLKAQEKTKIIGADKSESKKQEYVDLGVQAIWEKNNLFPMLLVFSVDPTTHLSTVKKCHDDLWEIFPSPKLITKADGEKVRLWNEGGEALGPNEQLKKRARAAAENGMAEYTAFFQVLTPKDRKVLAGSTHEENKRIAAAVVTEAPEPEANGHQTIDPAIFASDAWRDGVAAFQEAAIAADWKREEWEKAIAECRGVDDPIAALRDRTALVKQNSEKQAQMELTEHV